MLFVHIHFVEVSHAIRRGSENWDLIVESASFPAGGYHKLGGNINTNYVNEKMAIRACYKKMLLTKSLCDLLRNRYTTPN